MYFILVYRDRRSIGLVLVYFQIYNLPYSRIDYVLYFYKILKINERKEKQQQKWRYTQHCKLLFGFPKHTLLSLYCFEWLLKWNEQVILYIYNAYVLIKKPLNLQIHNRNRKRKITKLKDKISSTRSSIIYTFLACLISYFVFAKTSV